MQSFDISSVAILKIMVAGAFSYIVLPALLVIRDLLLQKAIKKWIITSKLIFSIKICESDRWFLDNRYNKSISVSYGEKEKVYKIDGKDVTQEEFMEYEKNYQALPGFTQLKPFIIGFANTANVTSSIMQVLKNKGLNQATYEQCRHLSENLPRNSKVKKRLLAWLQRPIEIQQHITSLPLLVSSDIIESLFGNFKHIIERSPQADMNRTTLLIPALCGNPNAVTIAKALSRARHGDLQSWEQDNIPYTMRRRRQAFFKSSASKKRGNDSQDIRGISTA